jgi:hypothetical protein
MGCKMEECHSNMNLKALQQIHLLVEQGCQLPPACAGGLQRGSPGDRDDAI